MAAKQQVKTTFVSNTNGTSNDATKAKIKKTEAQLQEEERDKWVVRTLGFGFGALLCLFLQILFHFFGQQEKLQVGAYRVAMASICAFLSALIMASTFESTRKLGIHAGLFATFSSTLLGVVMVNINWFFTLCTVFSCMVSGIVGSILSVSKQKGSLDIS